MTSTAAQTPKSTPPEIPRKRLITIFIGLILGILMAALDQTIVATAMPTIAGQLNGLKEISWIITAYLLGQAISMPLYGKVGDYIGRRNAFHLAILIFLAGSVVAGLAQSMGMLIAFRALQGAGAGGLMIGAQTIMAAIVTPRERAKYMSVMGPMIGVATVLGPLIGGYLTDAVSWRWIFYINVPIGAASLVITALTLKLPKESTSKKVDYWGSLFMAGAITCLMLVLSWGGRRYDWDSAAILWLIAGAVVFTPIWLLIERKTEAPILPLHLFKDAIFRINAPLAFLIGIAMFGAVSYLPTYLQLSRDVSATMSGILMLPMMGGLMAAAVMTGQLISRTGRYKVFPIIGTAVAAVGLYLLSLIDASSSEWATSVSMFILGFGIGLVMPTLVLTVQNSVAAKDVGPATAGVNFFRQVGASFGTALIGSLFVGRLTDELAKNLPQAAASKIGQHASGITPKELDKLPPDIAHHIVISYANALMPLYKYFVPLLIIGFILVWFLKEKPLTTGRRAPEEHRPEQSDQDGDGAANHTPEHLGSAHPKSEPPDGERGHHGAHAADSLPDRRPEHAHRDDSDHSRRSLPSGKPRFFPHSAAGFPPRNVGHCAVYPTGVLLVLANGISLRAMHTSSAGKPSTTHYLVRRDGRIAYDVTGSGPLIVCVPGMGDIRSTFRFLIPALTGAGFRVATMDLRGHGDSDATFPSYDDESAADDVAALISELGGPAIVAGNSMGAAAGVLAAAVAPQAVSGLVLIGPFIRDPHSSRPMRALLRIALSRPFARLVWNAYLPSLYAGTKGDDFDEHRREIMRALKRRGHTRAFSKTAATSHAPAEAVIDTVRTPSLVVMGTRDPDFPDPAAEAGWIADTLAGEVLMVDDAGHYPHAQRPDIVSPAVVDFASAVTADA